VTTFILKNRVLGSLNVIYDFVLVLVCHVLCKKAEDVKLRREMAEVFKLFKGPRINGNILFHDVLEAVK
jgi:hypothetical protein